MHQQRTKTKAQPSEDRSSGKADRAASRQLSAGRLLSMAHSPMARKIVLFNLLGMVVLVAGLLILNPTRDSLAAQHERDLAYRAQSVAGLVEALLEAPGPAAPAGISAETIDRLAPHLSFEPGVTAYFYDASGALVGSTHGRTAMAQPVETGGEPSLWAMPITSVLQTIADIFANLFGGQDQSVPADLPPQALSAMVSETLQRGSVLAKSDGSGAAVFAVAAPIKLGGSVLGAVGLSADAAEIEHLVWLGRERILQMFLIALLISIGLSLLLASTIANPLSDLAAAAQIGHERKRSVNPGRVRIPDLSRRPDEIGRLSGALRGMVTALYDRIDANEQFAADVAHEIKNPLASLRSAVGSLRLVKKEEHRAKLLDVIEHDVRRLDRLVSDISNASRLDSELVKEDEQPFNLLQTLANLTEHMSQDARLKGVEFITDLPPDPVIIQGLEARLAQVFVNLISNAMSFCETGDAIRVWARRRENRVLVVVEDTGPGIPEQALTKVFKRFYSDRPASHFGNNSGLGLAISKQIVEAHGGVIWAENIRPTDAEPDSPPLGARFVVGLPV